MSEDAVHCEVTDIARHRPRLEQDTVRRILAERYGVSARLETLPSDRDLNFAVYTGECNGSARDSSSCEPSFVFKIAHALEDRQVLQAHHAVMRRLAGHGLAVPAVVPALDGEDILQLSDEQGRRHFARLLSWLSGVPLASVRPRSCDLLSDLGRFVGRMSSALTDFKHPALERSLVWDMARAAETVTERMEFLEAGERALVEPFLRLFRDTQALYGGRLRRSVVHHDANDWNVLVNGPEHRNRRVAGLIDFGDMLVSFAVADVAVAAAYGVLGMADPLRAASVIAASCHRAFPLDEHDTSVLFPFLAMRLCVSVCMSAHQQRMEPDNAYLMVSRKPALRTLTLLRDVPPRFAEYVFRHVCGYEPCPNGTRIAAWRRRSSRGTFAPVVSASPSKAVTFDFSTQSSEWTFRNPLDPERSARQIQRRMLEEEAGVGIGRYAEVRLAYRGEQFRTGSQMRTVHLGVDLFQPPESPVFAPLDGVVCSVADYDNSYDYGPTVLLEHALEGGPVFHTLYGHLSRDSIKGLQIGSVVRAGEKIAEIGTSDENGGWAPHVHVQIIADRLDIEGAFPGVAPPWCKEVWMAVSPDPSDLLGLSAEARAPLTPNAPELLARRRERIAPSLSVSYRAPLCIHRGHMAHLYDENGQPFLDTVNNVAHVGHAHPRVAEAVARRLRVLNTNTRYLYDELSRYAERLAARLPDPLSVCFFVNSGSEANDLALRIARAHTGFRDVAAIEQAYHGHLSSLIAVSSYKFDGKGGQGRPAHVHIVPTPDPYRHAGSADDHATLLRRTLANAPDGVAAFMAESAMGCAGQVFFPDGYLRKAFDAAREAGAVCIADEVQTGFGRMGETFWAFELQGAIPDIVTMGKPIGNGYPLGAVVTTPELTRSFDTGMEYFNTFGGSPASCAAGLAVLDAIEEEGLMQRAFERGGQFLDGLTALAGIHEMIGDVRGHGLFLGVELVASRTSKEPAGQAACYVVERMRESGILASVDGPYGNVLKIKPPMVIETFGIDRYVETLDRILHEDFVRAAVACDSLTEKRP